MNSAALNALFARAEIFNKFEELSSQLTVEEAEIASAYLENLIKTRPIRRPESCPENEQNPELDLDGIAEETNCEFCRAGHPRIEKDGQFVHEIDRLDSCYFGIPEQNLTCGAQNAQN